MSARDLGGRETLTLKLLSQEVDGLRQILAIGLDRQFRRIALQGERAQKFSQGFFHAMLKKQGSDIQSPDS